MLKNLFKIMVFCFMCFQYSSAVSVNDGFEEYNKGNVFQALNIFEEACEGGAYVGCYNAALIYYKGSNTGKFKDEFSKHGTVYSKD